MARGDEVRGRMTPDPATPKLMLFRQPALEEFSMQEALHTLVVINDMLIRLLLSKGVIQKADVQKLLRQGRERLAGQYGEGPWLLVIETLMRNLDSPDGGAEIVPFDR